MWKEERFQRIRLGLKTFGGITINRTALELDVSEETIRRDIKELEARGELQRIHGGAVSAEKGVEPPISLRSTEHVKEKRAIAKAAIKHIRSGQIVFIDAGSTTTILANEMATLSGITVITNSVNVAQIMSHPKSRISNNNVTFLLGGILNESLLATFGEKTISEIYRYKTDIAILSPVGIDAQYGATSFDPAEAEIARAMVANTNQVFLLADHSKIGVTSRVSYCDSEHIHTLITNQKSQKNSHYDILRNKVLNVITSR